MKAAPFAYQRPSQLTAALAALAEDDTSAISGGQSLGPMLNLRLARPARLVDLRRLPELRDSRVADGHLHLGAAITHAEIEDGVVPDTTAGMLPSVARGIAYRAIRNRGTLGGSLSHADPAADWVNALIALGARVHLASASGRRVLAIEAFVRGAYHTAKADGEIVASVELPAFSQQMRWGYYKVCAKVGEFASAIGAVVVDPVLGHCRLLIGAVESVPVLVADPAPWVTTPTRPAAALIDPLSAVVAAAFPTHDPVFVHQHAVALARAIEQMGARQR